MTTSISFPNLGLYFSNVGKNISIFGFEIAYYGIVLAIAMVTGICLAMWAAKKTGQNPDSYFDFAMIAIVVSLICARLYYVIFSWDYYGQHPLEILNFREGGLAIYGGVIGGVLTCFIYSKVKKMRFGQVLDTACLGLIWGQCLGRWGNFFNREAFGGYTDNLLAMRLPVDAVRSGELTSGMLENAIELDGIQYIQVHPTFLYESLWNLGVLVVLLIITLKLKKKFHGEIFLFYGLLYGLGRFWIEGLRTDQLLLPVIKLPVSQVLSALLVVGCLIGILVLRRRGTVLEDHTAERYDKGE
ncbi:MAG: prolipoprotein diacylglyceryl transferase [Lachnospiraceae bacterium]|nr:prolipoprotein diacylglyceryl transferase [Lachnospiraceae bacterium]